MKLYFCQSCARVYYLKEDSQYLCGRIHAASVWPDGKLRRFVISQRTETNRPPWPIPKVVEERELFNQDVIETWLDECQHPDDSDYGDVIRHFGYSAPGGRHLTTEQVLDRYKQFVLKLVPE